MPTTPDCDLQCLHSNFESKSPVRPPSLSQSFYPAAAGSGRTPVTLLPSPEWPLQTRLGRATCRFQSQTNLNRKNDQNTLMRPSSAPTPRPQAISLLQFSQQYLGTVSTHTPSETLLQKFGNHRHRSLAPEVRLKPPSLSNLEAPRPLPSFLPLCPRSP